MMRARIRVIRCVVLTALACGLVSGALARETVGESIYSKGMLSPDKPLEGARENGIGVKGAEAACVNCHLRSGLGSKEGELFIPPITGEYLFYDRAHGGKDPVLPYVESMRGNRAPYTPVTVARAIREGLDSDGRKMGYLMPRYALSDADMTALIAYLKKLSVLRSPGVTQSTLNFATVFTPDADPAKRAGVLEILQRYVVETNSFPIGPQPRMWTSGKTAFAKSMYMSHLRWQLHVWSLTGAPGTWRAQLEQHLKEEPVFALLSGLGGSNWLPVHEFCEQQEIPCLFPNVEVPPVEQGGFYSLYFSKGVLLEAELIANRLAAEDKSPGFVVEQIYRRGDSGQAAAQALVAALKAQGVTVRDHALAPGKAGSGLGAAVHAAEEARALVLWLRPGDIAALGSPPAHAKVYMSGLMGGLEDTPVPAQWRERTYLAFPLDVPERRGVRLDYPLGWFHFRQIPIVAQQVQVDTYLACSLVSQVLRDQIADSFVRAYFVEQLQQMLEHRLITGYYPHLALSYHERFASRGGYIARFTPAGTGTRLVADGEWTVP
jgi:hypothetical protein